MCYSAEVQLTTALIIFISCIFFYFYYSHKYSKSNKKWLKPFLNNVILVFACIGGHQLFEFLSLITGNQIIYKIGLMISISGMYFILRSLEMLTNKNFYSKFAIILIIGIGIHAFLVPMHFERFSFHLRHLSAFIWAFFWLLLFIYWHVCVFSIWKNIDKKSKKTIIWYLLTSMDISFILAVIYTFWGYLQFSVNVCTDSPSIWCTFFIIQTFFIPIFLSSLPLAFKRQVKKTSISVRSFIIYLLISLLILTLMVSTLPFFKCLIWKFVFP